MATPDYTAQSVITGAQALLNDSAAQIFTNTVMLPFVQTAVRDLRELLEQSNVPVTNAVDSVLAIPAGTTEIGFATTPALPSNLINIQQIWESVEDENNWIPMQKVEFLPYWAEGQTVENFGCWAWIGNEIKVLESSQDNDLKLNYIAQLLPDMLTVDTVIGIINGQSFLIYRSASLAAKYLGEDVGRSDYLDNEAGSALDRLVNIENKARQAIYTRRKPFRMSWKNRGIWG